MKASSFFTPEQQAVIVRAIAEAEHSTSGEIRVHVETSCKGDILDEAAWLFRKLGMHKTADRNGVLIYLAVRERKFAIIGDTGLNSVVPLGFWDQIRDHIKMRFSENLFAEGLAEGIIMAGVQLKDHFPFTKDDINELTDTISFDINKTTE
ncbi:MAG: TPM domain-containing protein [Bacteroidales bacterium]|nr:TPM domain-containing protein [Bacteroidales bacterium]